MTIDALRASTTQSAIGLLDRLRPLASDPAFVRHTAAGTRQRGPGVFSHCSLEKERIARVRLDHPVIGIVLQGSKQIWFDAACRSLTTGDVFILPASVDLDADNLPDPARGLYESLIIEVSTIPAMVPPPAPGSATDIDFDIRVPLTPALADTIAHAAFDLTGTSHFELLGELRLAELLLLLRELPQARPLFSTGLRERVRWLVFTAPDRGWTAKKLGQHLGVGESTLRRHLAGEGTSLRRVVRDTRLLVAREMLKTRGGRVMAAASAAGYSSRSHFARAYRLRFGVLPSESLSGNVLTPVS